MCKSSKTLPLCVAYMPVATPVAVSMLHPCGYPDMPVVTMVLIGSNFGSRRNYQGWGTKAKAKVRAEARALGAQCTLGLTSPMPAY